jgi:hypothetical protein
MQFLDYILMLISVKNKIKYDWDRWKIRLEQQITEIRKIFSEITLEKVFQSNFGLCVPKYLNFWKMYFEKINFLENRIQKILEYKWEKINIKTTFKSILKNRIWKNINFRKHFPKTIYEGKIEISEGLEEILRGRREKF